MSISIEKNDIITISSIFESMKLNQINKGKDGQPSIQLLCGFVCITLGFLLSIISLIIGSIPGILVGIVCLATGFLLRFFFYRKEEHKRRQIIQDEIETSRAKQRKEEQEREEEIWNFKDANGECDKLIIHNNLRLELYNKAQKVIFFGTLYSFKDILSCELIEKENIETTSVVVGHKDEVTTTYTTKTSGKSLAGRAIVGGLIAGPVGAIIGGATARRTTVAENQVTSKPIMGTKEYKSIIYRLLIKTTKSKSTLIFVTSKKEEADEIKEVFDSIINANSNLN